MLVITIQLNMIRNLTKLFTIVLLLLYLYQVKK